VTPSRFALIGAAGFIAPRHMKAIQDTGNTLVTALDPKDSVGVMDSYFPEADFFVEFERFDRHVDKLRRKGSGVDYVSICSPNYLHDSHIRFALRSGAHAVCEKPMVLNPWNVDALAEIERESDRRIFNILQLRLHPSLAALKKRVEAAPKDTRFDVELTYITPRGKWYFTSWKGDEHKSGGIATNIGIHFFDMLCWVFGAVKENRVHLRQLDTAAGWLELEQARVRWLLSVDPKKLPKKALSQGQRTYRSITVDGEEVEFSGGFTDLHTLSYEKILQGQGFGVETVRPSIQVAHDIRNVEPIGLHGDYHPLLRP
jgi:UDP-N-acetyl-2-amino-2-deoxyglucuronate dehydrogenase